MDKVAYYGMILAAFIACVRGDAQAAQLFLLIAILFKLDMVKGDKP